ncbi:MAG TPA: hypothetical protein VMO47_03420, partial [Rhodothermales bacterium]|nr:hypothetical protein [Rhodothermales bacterium]
MTLNPGPTTKEARRLLSEPELDLLRRQVGEAEKGTPGEIVVFVVPRSGFYESVLWRGGALGLALSIVVWTVLATSWPGWGRSWLWSPWFGIALSGACAVACAFIAQKSGWLFRTLAGRAILAQQVRDHAKRTFLDEGMMETLARTGILLYVSILERRIEVVADKGINAVVPEDRWIEIVDLIRR